MKKLLVYVYFVVVNGAPIHYGLDTFSLSARLEWAAMKTLLGDPSMMKRLIEVEKDSLSDATLRKLKKYTESPKFLPDEVRRDSGIRAGSFRGDDSGCRYKLCSSSEIKYRRCMHLSVHLFVLCQLRDIKFVSEY